MGFSLFKKKEKTASSDTKPDFELIFDQAEPLRPHQDDRVWKREAIRNAKHRADVFIELGDPRRTAECFQEFSTLEAMSHLHALADRYRHNSQVSRADIVLLDVDHIRPKEQTRTEPGVEHWHQYRQPFRQMRRCLPCEIFDTPVGQEYQVTIIQIS